MSGWRASTGGGHGQDDVRRGVRAGMRLYLAGCSAAFYANSLQLFQVVCAPAANNGVPWTRAHVYPASAATGSPAAATSAPPSRTRRLNADTLVSTRRRWSEPIRRRVRFRVRGRLSDGELRRHRRRRRPGRLRLRGASGAGGGVGARARPRGVPPHQALRGMDHPGGGGGPRPRRGGLSVPVQHLQRDRRAHQAADVHPAERAALDPPLRVRRLPAAPQRRPMPRAQTCAPSSTGPRTASSWTGPSGRGTSSAPAAPAAPSTAPSSATQPPAPASSRPRPTSTSSLAAGATSAATCGSSRRGCPDMPGTSPRRTGT